MAARILNGNEFRDQIYAELRKDIESMEARGIRPGLAAILVGDNPASKLYVSSKIAGCQKLGMASTLLTPPASTTTEQLLDIIQGLNDRDDIYGILVQMPLPPQIDKSKILDAVLPEKDVDGFHPINVGRMVTGKPHMAPCTPSGVMEILRRSNVRLAGMNTVVMGKGDIVGKPMGIMLLNTDASVTVCHLESRAADVIEFARKADILIVAIGDPAFVTPDYIMPGATVIDVGQNVIVDREKAERVFANYPEKLEAFRKKGRILVGDVHPDVAKVAGAITPVPGGVGPLTIAMLMSNTVRAAKMRRAGNREFAAK